MPNNRMLNHQINEIKGVYADLTRSISSKNNIWSHIFELIDIQFPKLNHIIENYDCDDVFNLCLNIHHIDEFHYMPDEIIYDAIPIASEYL